MSLWSPTASYNFGDTVEFQGQIYYLIVAGVNYTIGTAPGGGSPWSATAPAVGAPTPAVEISVTNINDTTATIALFFNPNTAVSPPLSYAPTITGGAVTTRDDLSTGAILLYGLVPNTPYTVTTIGFTNTAGTNTGTYNVSFTTSEVIPPPITSVTASSITSTGFTLNWVGGTPTPQDYAFPLNNVVVAPSSLTPPTAVFTNLAGGQSYVVVIVCSNNAGSVQSNPITVSLPQPTPSPPVTAITGTALTPGSTTLLLSWTGGLNAVTGSFLLSGVAYPQAVFNFSGSSVAVSGLTASTNYTAQIILGNPFGPSQSSTVTPFSTTAAPPPPPTETLTTLCVTTFLVPVTAFGYSPSVQSGKLPINSSVYWSLSVDAPNGTDNQTYGNFGLRSFLDSSVSPFATYGTSAPTTFNATGQCFNDNGSDYTVISNTYLNAVRNSPNTKLIVSLGGFYADILGLFGPAQVAGAVSGWVQASSTGLIDSISNIFYNNGASPNPLGWSRSGWGSVVWDGLNLDFENIGRGGNPNQGAYNGFTSAQVQFPPKQPGYGPDGPAFPANKDDLIPLQGGGGTVKFSDYIQPLADMVAHHYAIAPTKILNTAPVGATINGTLTTNICSPYTALGTWFAFPLITTVPSNATFNTASSPALNHPNQMSYVDDVFVQFYNEPPQYYLGSPNFTNLVAQWGFVALKAQALNRKRTRINLGFTSGYITNPNGTAPPAIQPNGFGANGPNPGYNVQAPTNSWYPQYAGATPPNATDFVNNSPTKDPPLVAQLITDVTAILINTFPGITASSWCSGMGFWAGKGATEMCDNIYNSSSQFHVTGLPRGYTYTWGEAYYPAIEPGWLGNVPIVPR